MFARARQMSLHLVPARPRIIFSRNFHLEVESKFSPRSNFRAKVAQHLQNSHANAPSQSQFKWLTERFSSIRDTYFDHQGELVKNGIWVRRRQSQEMEKGIPASSDHVLIDEWEAKVRVGGDFINSQFREVQGEDAVQEIVDKYLPQLRLQELTAEADLKTFRSSWDVSSLNGAINVGDAILPVKMSIVIDDTASPEPTQLLRRTASKFQHTVGEIEVVALLSDDKHQDSETKHSILAQMEKLIAEFKSHHADMISETVPTGKLSAFYTWRKTQTVGRD